MKRIFFFAHNRLFRSKRQYCKSHLWRWFTCIGTDSKEASLAKCNTEQVAGCWQGNFRGKPQPRVTKAELLAELEFVRLALEYNRADKLDIKKAKNRVEIFWPGYGYAPDVV